MTETLDDVTDFLAFQEENADVVGHIDPLRGMSYDFVLALSNLYE